MDFQRILQLPNKFPRDTRRNKMDVNIYYCFFLSLLALPIVLLIFKRLFPRQAKTVQMKMVAWLMNKMIWRVHAKCTQQKKCLFESVGEFKSNPYILEIGVGPGSNLAFLPERCILDCLEPNEHHKPYLLQALSKFPNIRLKNFVTGFAEDMGMFKSGTFDAVVCTLVLCSVRDPDQVLSEVRRVLKPGGQFLFLEHVAGPQGSFYRSVQEALNRIWPVISEGCQLTRETSKIVEKAGFSEVKQEHFQIRLWFFPFLKFGLYGRAIK